MRFVSSTGVLFATVSWMDETAGPAGWCNVHNQPSGMQKADPGHYGPGSKEALMDGVC